MLHCFHYYHPVDYDRRPTGGRIAENIRIYSSAEMTLLVLPLSRDSDESCRPSRGTKSRLSRRGAGGGGGGGGGLICIRAIQQIKVQYIIVISRCLMYEYIQYIQILQFKLQR